MNPIAHVGCELRVETLSVAVLEGCWSGCGDCGLRRKFGRARVDSKNMWTDMA